MREAPAGTPHDAAQALPDLVLVVHRSGAVLTCLGGRQLEGGPLPQDLAGRSLEEIWPQPIAARLMQLVRRVLKTREAVSHACTDSERTYEARVSVQGRDRALLVFRDVTGESGSRPAFGARSGSHGADLAAREAFLLETAGAIAKACLVEQRAAVCLIHLGGLESVDLTLGLEQGERIVGIATERLLGLMRESAAADPGARRLARLGHDVLVFRLERIADRDAVAAVAERLQAALREPIADGARELVLEPAIGIALVPEDGNDLPRLLEHARAALLEAREGGSASIVFHSDTLKLKALMRPDLERELAWAMEREQFVLHFQPRIELATGRIVALECLLRWMHPIRGSVDLAEFLPLTEVTKLGIPLGRWVLEEAAGAIGALQRAGCGHVRVSVNVGRRHFSSLELAADLQAALDAGRLAPESLELEVTERMLTRAGGAVEALRQLRARGLRVLVDEFGTGYFSLSELRDMPIDAVKMPRRFVSSLAADPRARSICAASIGIARAFGLAAVAVGIETESQRELLQADGCHEGQGFLFAAPAPLTEVLARLKLPAAVDAKP